MVTAFQWEKFTHCFRLLDFDGDGYIDEADFELMARRMIVMSGAIAQPRVQEIYAAYRSVWFWLYEETHAPLKAKISQDVFLQACVASLEEEGGFDRIIRPALNAILATFDTNRDGQLSAEEFCVWLMANRVRVLAMT